MSADHEIVIVGAGFSGIGMAHSLLQAGRDDFIVLERNETVGGTWWENTYPGIGCDVPTPLYSFSFAPNPDWSHFYAKGAEIQAYLEDVVDRFGIRPKIRTEAEALSATWVEEAQHWRIEVAGAEPITARVLIGGLGGLNQPSFPAIDGLGDFEGHLCHTQRWDHDVDLSGKRVAVIGTGASAIQVVPELAKTAAHLDVYQRTAPWIFPKMDFQIGPRLQRLFKRVPIVQKLLRGAVFSFSESLALPLTRIPRMTALLTAAGRAHLRRQVPDPELRERLTPAYSAGCKRMLPSNDWFPALQRDNVDLVTEPIARVTATGIVTADGHEHPADAVICSTGFDIKEAFSQLQIRGRDGIALSDAWQGGIKAHRGTMIAGFPNMLMLSGPNTGTGSTSQVYMIESQIHYAMEILGAMSAADLGSVDVKAEAQADYNDWIRQRMGETVWLKGGCDSWYLVEDGHSPVLYPGFSSQFRRSLRHFQPEEYRLEPARSPAPTAAPQHAAAP